MKIFFPVVVFLFCQLFGCSSNIEKISASKSKEEILSAARGAQNNEKEVDKVLEFLDLEDTYFIAKNLDFIFQDQWYKNDLVTNKLKALAKPSNKDYGLKITIAQCYMIYISRFDRTSFDLLFGLLDDSDPFVRRVAAGTIFVLIPEFSKRSAPFSKAWEGYSYFTRDKFLSSFWKRWWKTNRLSYALPNYKISKDWVHQYTSKIAGITYEKSCEMNSDERGELLRIKMNISKRMWTMLSNNERDHVIYCKYNEIIENEINDLKTAVWDEIKKNKWIKFAVKEHSNSEGRIYEQFVLRNKTLMSKLVELLNSKDPSKEYTAAAIIGNLGDRSSVKLLIPLLSHEKVRAGAIAALGKIGGKESADALLRFASENRDLEDLKGRIIWALGETRDVRALPVLQNYLVRDHTYEYRLAAKAVGKINSSLALPYIIEKMKNGELVESTMHMALKRITKADLLPIASEWRAWWEKNKDRILKEEAEKDRLEKEKAEKE